ncbi:Serine/threonine-protein kinase BCK1/SLK1/SSP31 [Morella rubra]|uniref:Serine/threonine-protein kinase BCK1/SLK1/SSP31 n=1 Tax=Morella rubra TaxID=262757 RepID=A0A6A1V410_9ROSI|nr:Serine/threonine-protein kinase BCK1/SLK1/SSP31 [Morella rubra]
MHASRLRDVLRRNSCPHGSSSIRDRPVFAWSGCDLLKWLKVQVLGRGSYGTVYLATPATPKYCPIGSIAVKSAALEHCMSLKKEATILREFTGCSEIVRCLGVDLSVEDGLGVYNLLLEYASEGTLLDVMKKNGGRLQEPDVQRYTRMIVKGLRCIHEKGYVHCDLKPANVLVFCSEDGASSVKIADFGLSKIPGEENEFVRRNFTFRGTPIYMSPESVLLGEIQSPLDIWSLGCMVIEMLTGNLAWTFKDMRTLMFQIALGNEPPKIPETMSEVGKDFLGRCFVREPRKRWTAEMLLRHPFLDETQVFPSTGYPLHVPPSVSKNPSASRTLGPPPGFELTVKRQSLPKNLPLPPSELIPKEKLLPKNLPLPRALANNLPPPPGFEFISERKLLPRNLPPPPEFSSISRKQTVARLAPPPGFSFTGIHA